MIYVLGSGPSGVSSAKALIEDGYDVTMLDAGIDLEIERQNIVEQLSAQPADAWEARAVERLKENMTPGASGVAVKYTYGSDFPYQKTDTFTPRELRNAVVLSSLAKGGLSNVWGAAVLPYCQNDISDWPIGIADLEPHYRAVLKFTGLAAVADDLRSRFPIYSEDYAAMPSSKQIARFLSDLAKSREELLSDGFSFGCSRLAVAARSTHDYECATCGLCLYGCPYGLIYNSAMTLANLRKDARFTYIGGVVVNRLEESNDTVRVSGTWLNNREPVHYDASRVYVAAGALSSTKLILDSLEAYDTPLTLRDSQYFMVPLMRYRGVGRIVDEPLHTLAQAFIEISDPNLSERTVHLQVYGYNDLYKQALENVLGTLYPLSRFAVNAFLNRFLLIQGYLHSDLSETISLTLRPPRNGLPSQLLLAGSDTGAGRRLVKKVVKNLGGHRSQFKAVPFSKLLKIGRPGEGNHSGGSLPMRSNPQKFESDISGRPTGFKRVHVVDASVFPTIPATTITLSIMANAHRIASAHAEY